MLFSLPRSPGPVWSPPVRDGSTWSAHEYLEFDFLRVARLTGFQVGAAALVAGTEQYRTAAEVALEAAGTGPGAEFYRVPGGQVDVPPGGGFFPLSPTVRARSVRIFVTELAGENPFPLGVNK